MSDGFEPGKRYRDTTTGRHVLFLYGPTGAPTGAEWGYIVTSLPDGTISDEIGAVHWVMPYESARYLELPPDVGTILGEQRNVMGVLFDEVDPNDDGGEWDNDRLPALALAVVMLFELIDDQLQDAGSLPPEWNPYTPGQQCSAPHVGCDDYDDTKHCRCMRRRCDGHHGCACGHTWETEQA